jgi:hypothetical protein
MSVPSTYILRRDVASTLTGAALAHLQGATSSEANVEYARGVIASLRANCAAFAIPWPTVSAQLRQALTDAGRCDLLDTVARLTP